jgi:hypothetical protein
MRFDFDFSSRHLTGNPPGRRTQPESPLAPAIRRAGVAATVLTTGPISLSARASDDREYPGMTPVLRGASVIIVFVTQVPRQRARPRPHDKPWPSVRVGWVVAGPRPWAAAIGPRFRAAGEPQAAVLI